MSERYEIKGKLARGGIGAIYLAHDNSLDREVAIKRLLPLEETNLNEAADESLSREASALAKFTHPNVVTIYSFEEDEDGAFVVTELIKGENLKETTERGAFTIEDFENLVEQTLDPLITALDLNLLHRDIKPANIMVTILASGRFQIKILDFGLAKFSQTPSTQTLDQQGSFLGSIEYLAPEQLELRPLDQRTDLYSLGCVYYYTLTQVSPFEGKNAALTMDNHLEHHVTDIREHRDDISDELAAWLMRLINRQPEDRPDNARVALEEYRAAQKGAMPPGGTHSIIPNAAVAVVPISEPVKLGDADPVGVATASQAISVHTGPMGETTGQRMLKQKQAELEEAKSKSTLKLPLLGLIAVSAIALGIFLFSGGDSQQTPVSPQEIGTSSGVTPKAVGQSNSTQAPRTTANPPASPPSSEVVEPGFKPLPEVAPGVLTSLAPPVTEPLVGHYYAGIAAYGNDFKTVAAMGESVHVWGNLAPNAAPLHYLSRLIDAESTAYYPRRVSVAPDRFPATNRVHPAIKFPRLATLLTRNEKAKKDLEGSSFQFFFVGAVEPAPFFPIINFTEVGDYSVGLFIAAYEKSIRADRRSKTVGDFVTPLPFSPGNLAVYCYQIDFEKGRQTLRITTPDGKSSEKVTEGLSIEPTQIGNYRIAGHNPSGPSDSEMTMIELLIYNRQLSAEDTRKVEQSLVKRYFSGGNVGSPTTQSSSAAEKPEALPVQRKLIAHFDASVGVIDQTAPAKKGGSVTSWQNSAPNSDTSLRLESRTSAEDSPRLREAESTQNNDPFPVVVLSEGNELQLGNQAAPLEEQFPTNDITILMLLRTSKPSTGLIARVDGAKAYGMMMFNRTPGGLSLGYALEARGKKDWLKIPLKSAPWLLWSISFDDQKNLLESHLSYPKGGWVKNFSKKMPELPAEIASLQLGARKAANSKMTDFEISQYAVYNAALTDKEKQAVFEQWRKRFFKSE